LLVEQIDKSILLVLKQSWVGLGSRIVMLDLCQIVG